MGRFKRRASRWEFARIAGRLVVAALAGLVIAVGGARLAQAGPGWSVFLPVVLNGRPPPASQVKPPTDPSFYITTTDPSDAYNLGCSQGVSDASFSPPVNSLVVLDVGGQRPDGSGTLLVDGVDASNAQIEAIGEAFAHGYWYCTGTADLTSVLSLVIGTNNSYYDVSATGGNTWASVVAAIAAADRAAGYDSQVVVDGGNDLEPGWDSAGNSEAWANGYTAAASTFYVDYGSADGCPMDSAVGAACAGDWTQHDVWYVSWGAGAARALPEIYVSGNASQWAMLGLYGADYEGSGGEIFFSGSLDTYPLWTGSNTSEQAWSEFWTDLNGNPATAQDMPYSAEMYEEP